MGTEGQTTTTAGTYERVSRVKDDREDARDRERSVGKLQAKITDVQRRVEQAITPPALAGLLAGDPGEDVPTRWDRAPNSAKREVLRLLFSSIVVAKAPGEVDERVMIEWRGEAGR